MRLLITGVAGHFGSMLAQTALGLGWKVVGVDNLLYGGQGMLSFFGDPNFDFIRHDVSKGLPQGVGEVDAVMHFAGLIGPICDRDTDHAYATNVGSTKAIGAWVNEREIPLLFASTCSNYGIHSGLADEDSDLHPLGEYARNKVECEAFLSDEVEKSFAFRFATLAGLSPRPRFDTLLNQWVDEALKNNLIECYDPAAHRPFLHVRDAVSAIVTVINRIDDLPRHCYNVVGFNTTKGELADEIATVTGCKVTEVPIDTDRRDYAVSAKRIEKDLGFVPRISLADCIKEVHDALTLGVTKASAEHFNAT